MSYTIKMPTSMRDSQGIPGVSNPEEMRDIGVDLYSLSEFQKKNLQSNWETIWSKAINRLDVQKRNKYLFWLSLSVLIISIVFLSLFQIWFYGLTSQIYQVPFTSFALQHSAPVPPQIITGVSLASVFMSVSFAMRQATQLSDRGYRQAIYDQQLKMLIDLRRKFVTRDGIFRHLENHVDSYELFLFRLDEIQKLDEGL